MATLQVEKAYIELLKIPALHPFRLRNQEIYARLRDEIARASGDDPQHVQDHYEEEARLERGHI